MLPGISLEQGRASKGHGERAQAGSDTRASAGAKAVLRALRLAWLRRVTGVVALFHSAPGARGRDRVPHTASAPHSRASAPRGKERGQGAAGTPARRHAGTRARRHTHTHCRAHARPPGSRRAVAFALARLFLKMFFFQSFCCKFLLNVAVVIQAEDNLSLSLIRT